MLEDADRKYKKARQLLKDQSDSSSPHWDGQVRYVQDIEPRLQLLKTQILQAQLEIKRIQIAMEQKQS
jgi:multidrug resistance efflux pump